MLVLALLGRVDDRHHNHCGGLPVGVGVVGWECCEGAKASLGRPSGQQGTGQSPLWFLWVMVPACMDALRHLPLPSSSAGLALFRLCASSSLGATLHLC